MKVCLKYLSDSNRFLKGEFLLHNLAFYVTKSKSDTYDKGAMEVINLFSQPREGYTHGCISLTTLLVKHYNDLLDRQNYGRSRNEVTCFYVEDVFCIYLGSLYADFQEKVPNFSLC